MSAPKLSTSQQNCTLKGQQKRAMRNVLVSPYTCTCPELKESCHEEITKKLCLTFTTLNLCRVKGPWIRDREKRKVKKEEYQTDKKNLEDPRKKNLRRQLAVGLNCTARCLERNILRVVLVDQDTQPAILTRHLVPSAAVRQCPILYVNQLARTLAPVLGVSSLSALGIKKLSEEDGADLNELVEFLISRAAPVDIPWLKCEQSSGDDGKTEHDITVDPNNSTHPHHTVVPNRIIDSDQIPNPKHTPNLIRTTDSSCIPDCKQLAENKPTFDPIDFDKIYVRKSDSTLTEGKIKPCEFGSVGFVEFEASSDDEFAVNMDRVDAKPDEKKRKKRKAMKRKSVNNESIYETARIGKIRNNEDRPSVKSKKKKK